MAHEHVESNVGESAAFHFESVWRVNASIHQTWAVLSDVGSWSQWWPGVSSVVTEPPAAPQHTVGSQAQVEVKSPIGLTLSFRIDVQNLHPPKLVSFTAAGDLRGGGTWSLTENGPITTIRAVWCVSTRRKSIRLSRPVAARMHALVMKSGHKGLTRQLNRIAQ